MNPELRALVHANAGMVTRREATDVVPRWVVDHAGASGALRRVLPEVYLDPAAPVTAATRRRAALSWLDGRGALSHTSALEIWGHQHVFTAPGMPEFRRQGRIRACGRSFYLDVYADREMVNFELDGASVHADRRQRGIDLRRDALLATLGIMVIRFTHRRLVHETAAVRDEVLTILARRRAASSLP